MNPNLIGIVVRYVLSGLGVYLAASPEQVTFLEDNVQVILGAILAVAPMLYGLWREPSQKGADVAAEVDKGTAVVVKTPPGSPDIVRVEPSAEEIIRNVVDHN
jgi:hypothetical protein